jgi:serine protease Do
LNRFLPNYPYVSFIQTDAAINPGNSGGALFNLKGEIIGMVSTYLSKQGGYTNIAFAIGIDDVHRIAQRLINEKKIERGYLGAEMLVSERVSRKFGYKSSILLTPIEPNSPAEIGSLNAGDIIIGLDGKEFEDGGELHRLLERSYPDQNISITLIRDKQRKNITVTLGSAPLPKKEITNISTADACEKLGLILNENSMGIEVVTSYSIAKTTGFSPADEILTINGISVNTIQALNTQLNKLKETEIALLSVKRNGTVLTLPLGSKAAIKGYTTKN